MLARDPFQVNPLYSGFSTTHDGLQLFVKVVVPEPQPDLRGVSEDSNPYEVRGHESQQQDGPSETRAFFRHKLPSPEAEGGCGERMRPLSRGQDAWDTPSSRPHYTVSREVPVHQQFPASAEQLEKAGSPGGVFVN
jgi:hypothetical protein